MGKIYLITNKNNSKKYVGMTKNCIVHRFAQHIDNAFRTGINRRNDFYREITKSQENILNDFKVELLEECNDEIMHKREIHYISKIKPEYNEMFKSSYLENQKNNIIKMYSDGMNITEIRKHYQCRHDLIKNILAKNNIEIKKSRPNNCKKIFEFDYKGNLINKYINAGECNQQTNIDRGNIRLCCLKNTNKIFYTAGNRYFSYNEKINYLFNVNYKDIDYKIYSKKELFELCKKLIKKEVKYSQITRKNRKSYYGLTIRKEVVL